MRSLPDRIRHMVLFEFIAILIAATAGKFLLGFSMQAIGVLSIMMSALAMLWNFVYNWMFDNWYHGRFGMAERGISMRVLHAVLFEFGLLFMGLWIVMWWLNIGFWTALVMDLGFAAFFLFYAFAFNWAYDVIFPIQEEIAEPALP